MMHIESRWYDDFRIKNYLEKAPRFDWDGEEITNPYTYAFMDAIEHLVWRMSNLQLKCDTMLNAKIWVDETGSSFRVIAEVDGTDGLEK